MRADRPVTVGAVLRFPGADPLPGYADVTSSVTVASPGALVELVSLVPNTGPVAVLELSIAGGRELEIQDVTMAVAESGSALSTPQIARRLETLGRAMALVRYFYPPGEDEPDWDGALVDAVGRAMVRAANDGDVEFLRSVFAPIAPAVTFSSTATAPKRDDVTSVAGVWWHHAGVAGVDGNRYQSFEIGNDSAPAPPYTLYRSLPIDRLAGCSVFGLITDVRGNPGTVEYWIRFNKSDRNEEIANGPLPATGDLKIPADTRVVDVGLRITSHRPVDIQALQLKCSSRTIDLLTDGALTAHSDTASLYRQAPNLDCGQPPCLKVAPQTARPYKRDVHRERLATNVHIEIPLLLGSPSAARATTAPVRRRAVAASMLSARVAATLSAWGIVRYFYASLGDVSVRWDSVLSRYLPRIIAEGDPEGFHGVLREMIAEARDAHMGARHPADHKTWKPPLSLRQIGDTLLVWGVAPGFEDQASPGDELIRIDGRSARKAYELALRQSSSSTPGWKASVAVGKLIASEAGQIRELTLRKADGALSRVLFPTVPRETRVRERRPETGQRVAPGVSYVDLDTLDGARWRNLLPEMAAASAIVFDLRGYMTNTTFSVLTHFLDAPVSSPEWLVPLRASPDDAEVTYGKNQWTLYPAADRIRARAVFLVDGRSASAVETVLQIVKANRLGTIVGEQSGGCNGNTNMVPMPGGFLLRFTGMRVVGTDGHIVQGRGVTPDVPVVVTREGIRSGRDEVLEAALAEIARTSVQAR